MHLIFSCGIFALVLDGSEPNAEECNLSVKQINEVNTL